MQMTSSKNVSIIAMIESRRINGNHLGMTVKKEPFGSSLNFDIQTLSKEETSEKSVIKTEEAMAPHESRKDFYRRLQMGKASGSSRFLPKGAIPTPSEDGIYTSFVCMRLENWEVSGLLCFK
jgi:hypothetical protein